MADPHGRRDLAWIWHLGSRGGYLPLSFPAGFDREIGLLLVDADESAIRESGAPQLSDTRQPDCEVRQHCFAAWSEDGAVDIHLTACPYASGTKPLDPAFDDWFVFGNGDLDYVLGQAHSVARTRRVKARALDSVAHEWDGDVGAPFILSIDAQGAGHEILSGAGNLLKHHVDAVICELETIPFYGGTPSLALALADLTRQGFLFSHMLPQDEPWASPCRNPIGLRSRPLMGSVDAVFIRDPSSLGAGIGARRAATYALAACIVGHPDLAVAVLSRCAEPGACGAIEGFARALLHAGRRMQPLFPGSFGSTEASMPARNGLPVPEESPFERCLRQHGFTDLSNEVARRRRLQAPYAVPAQNLTGSRV